MVPIYKVGKDQIHADMGIREHAKRVEVMVLG